MSVTSVLQEMLQILKRPATSNEFEKFGVLNDKRDFIFTCAVWKTGKTLLSYLKSGENLSLLYKMWEVWK